MSETPTPGVYPGTPMAEYHGWRAASNSSLTRLMRSPAHLKAYWEAEYRDTDALRLGRAIHTAVLEPDDFDDRYTVADMCQAQTQKGKACTNQGLFMHANIGWVCGVHAKNADEHLVPVNRETLTEGDRKMCLAIRDAVHATKRARGMLVGPGEVELSVLWDDKDSGALCKARWDRHSPELAGGTIVDLKTTTDASPLAFERTIFKYGYHRQGALYLMSAKARKLPARHYTIIAVEKEPPSGVGIYRLTEGAIQGGEDQVRPLLRRYHECVTNDEWPCYPDEVRDISLPAWAWNQLDEQVEDVA
jgi:hypothetical protein